MPRIGPQHFPAWTLTVASMKATRDEKPDHYAVTVTCQKCREGRDVDLDRLIAEKGPDFSLRNRRSRCTLTPGCDGWCRFHYQSGVMRPLWDDRAIERWMLADEKERAR